MAHLTTGRKLGALTIIRLLGSGGMADVYEARDTRLGRRVAVKVLPDLQRRSGDFLGRFQREIRACASLAHVHIVTVYDSGESEGVHYYTMALLEGGDLRQRMREGMSERDVREVVRAVLRAFEHAHERGFVHRDVKPENILFDDHGTPVLTDFGIAKMLGAQTQMTQTGTAMGTPRYISPEQASGRDVDGRSDLYSLGCVLYEMLTGELPYTADTPIGAIYQHISAPIPRLPARYAHWQEFLDKLMAKAPEMRFQSATDTLEALDAVVIPRPSGVDESGVASRGDRVVTPVFIPSGTPSGGTPATANRAAAQDNARTEHPATDASSNQGSVRRAALALAVGLLVAVLALGALRNRLPSKVAEEAVEDLISSPAMTHALLPTAGPTAQPAAPVALPATETDTAETPPVAITTPTATPIVTPSATSAATPSVTPTSAATPAASATPPPTPRATPTPQPTARARPSPSASPRATPRKAATATPLPSTEAPSAEQLARQRRRSLEDQLRREEGQSQKAALEARLQKEEDAVRASRALEDELRREEQDAALAAGGDAASLGRQFAADAARLAETRALEDELRREEALAERLALEGKLERIEAWVRQQRAAEDAAATDAGGNLDINR